MSDLISSWDAGITIAQKPKYCALHGATLHHVKFMFGDRETAPYCMLCIVDALNKLGVNKVTDDAKVD